MDWTALINSAIFLKAPLFIPMEDLIKAWVCIDNFGILTTVSKISIKLDIEDTTSEASPNSSCIKSTGSGSNTDISIRKPKKKPKNAKQKPVKKKFICKLVA